MFFGGIFYLTSAAADLFLALDVLATLFSVSVSSTTALTVVVVVATVIIVDSLRVTTTVAFIVVPVISVAIIVVNITVVAIIVGHTRIHRRDRVIGLSVIPSTSRGSEYWAYGVCMLFFFILHCHFTLFIFSSFRDLRSKTPGQILLNFCIALSLTLVVFLAAAERSKTSSLASCRAAAIALHYFVLVVFMWMAIEAFNMYMAFVKVLPSYFPKFMFKCCIVAWGKLETSVNICRNYIMAKISQRVMTFIKCKDFGNVFQISQVRLPGGTCKILLAQRTKRKEKILS